MRILSVTDQPYLPEFKGGSSLVIHDLTERLMADGHEVAVMSSILPGGKIWLKNRIMSKIISKNLFPRDKLLGYPIFRGWNFPDGSREVIKNFSPDVVICHAEAPFYTSPFFYQERIPSIIYLHDVLFKNKPKIFDKTDICKVIANSQFTSKKYDELFNDKCDDTILPIMNLDNYECRKTPNYLTMINPTKMKGVDVIFQIAKARPDIPILIVESWSLGKEELYNLNKKLLNFPNIKFMRSVLDVRKIYEITKILIVPSVVEESWGRVVSEAQVSGTPVVARNIGGLPESVGIGGILVEKESAYDEWIEVISGLWDNKDRYEELKCMAKKNYMITKEKVDFGYITLVKIMSDLII